MLKKAAKITFGKEMAHLENLNLIGQMAASVGHEIRNPLTTVRGFLQLMGSKGEFKDYQEQFNLMIEELDRSNAMLKEFLSLAKVDPHGLEINNLKTIVSKIYPLIQADALRESKEIQLELGEVPNLNLDEREIRQLIFNLVRNGLEAMAPGGCLTIGTYIEKDEIILSLQDQGKGFNENVLNNLGKPFLTTKKNGTGLGLSVCYSIAKRHHATIDITTGSHGTTFKVKFKK